MAVAFFLHTSGTGIDASAEGTIPASTPDGAVMLAFLAHSSATATMTTPASGWTLLEADPNPADFSALAYWRIKQAGDAAPTWTWSVAGNWTVDIASFTGTHATTPVNTSIGEQIAAASAIALGSITPTAADCMLVAFGAVDAATGTRTWTESGAMTEALDQVDNQMHRVLAYELLAGGSGVAVSRTLTATDTAQDMAGFLIALEPAAGGGGGGGGASVAGEARPDTALTVTVTDANGNTKTLDSNAASPGDRPVGIQFASQQGSGWTTGSFTLSHSVDAERNDINLLDGVQIKLANGDTVYEGFVAGLPRSTDTEGRGTLTVNVAGWVASMADESFTMIFVDRDLSQWGGVSRKRQVNLVAANYTQAAEPSIVSDVTGTQGALVLQHASQWASPMRPVAETMYDAGPNNRIGRIYYNIVNVGAASVADAGWDLQIRASNVDDLSVTTADSGDIWALVPEAAAMSVLSASRYAFITFVYNTTPGGAAAFQYSVHVTNPAVWGDHGFNLYGDGEPYGVLASDVVRWVIDNYCPKLNTAGVQNTTYPIRHLTFRDDITPFDAVQKVNSYHLWHACVYENRTVFFEPIDLTEWDWEIRHDEVGNTIGLQGDEYTDLRNRIKVQFNNAQTGAQEILHYDDHAELRDESIDNPLNVHGRIRTGEPFIVPFPCTEADALELGRLRLLSDNEPKAPGAFNVTGHIRDRAGQLQPVSMVRAGDRIRLTSSANLSDRPRFIGEVSYSHGAPPSATITVDATARTMDAFLDRVSTALQAAGLQS